MGKGILTMDIKVTVTGGNIAEQVLNNIDALVEQVNTAAATAANMVRGMIDDQAKAMIAGSGKFGGRWMEGLHVTLDNMRISMSHDIPYADIFETGGTITGHPLLWLPIGGGPDAGEKLVSAANSRVPLMLSINDRTPKLFGTASVTIPKKWDMNGVITSAMSNFEAYFADAMKAG
jgi:hypothetical protein